MMDVSFSSRGVDATVAMNVSMVTKELTGGLAYKSESMVYDGAHAPYWQD